jgi:hypothetical protein
MSDTIGGVVKHEAFVQSTAGIVKDGVIVPDRPLPDNTYVEIVVPNAPRDVIERVRRRDLGQLGSAAVAESRSGDVAIDADVPVLLRYHGAETVLDTLLAYIRAWFPEAREILVTLEEDHDESGWIRVVTRIRLPGNYPHDRLRKQKLPFYEHMGEAVPDALAPLFVHQFDIAQESS